MIQEYAFDPSVLVAEYSRQYGFLRDSFNDTGRVLSQYPRKWRQKVMKMLGDVPEMDRTRLEALVSKWLLPHSIIRENSDYNGGDWLAEAEVEDARLPFYGILADANPRRHDRVIPFGAVVTGDHPLWKCTRSCRAARTAQDIVSAVTPILKSSKRVVLIDPYFFIEDRYCDVLIEIISVLTSGNCVHPIQEIQVCTALKGDDRRGKAPGSTIRRKLSNEFRKLCLEQIPNLVPIRFKVNFTVYFERERGVDAHDRHILTDIAGVDFGQGLDQRRSTDDRNHVRINLLDYDECCRLEEDFQPHLSGASASYLIEDEFTVEGSAD